MAILKEVELTLDLAPDIEIEASDKACAVAELIKMGADKVDEVRLAVIEACINAIEHSHAEDPRLHIRIAVVGEDEPQELEITIRDYGVGFDPEKLVQPQIEEKLKARSKRGWGMSIIEGLMDSVKIASSQDGTAIKMIKRR